MNVIKKKQESHNIEKIASLKSTNDLASTSGIFLEIYRIASIGIFIYAAYKFNELMPMIRLLNIQTECLLILVVFALNIIVATMAISYRKLYIKSQL